MTRVLKYQATVHYVSTGSSSTQQYTFSQAQADEVGGVLEADGLDYVLARKLCTLWTRRAGLGQYGSIRYSYTTLTEDDLRYYDNRKDRS